MYTNHHQWSRTHRHWQGDRLYIICDWQTAHEVFADSDNSEPARQSRPATPYFIAVPEHEDAASTTSCIDSEQTDWRAKYEEERAHRMKLEERLASLKEQ